MKFNLSPWLMPLIFGGCVGVSVLIWTGLLLLLTQTPLTALNHPEQIAPWLQGLYVSGLYSGLCLWLLVFQKKQGLTWASVGFFGDWVQDLGKGFWWGSGLLLGHYTLFICLDLLFPKYPVLFWGIGWLVFQNVCNGLAFAMIEEWLFRGWLLSTLSSQGLAKALWAQALFYALAHQQQGFAHPRFYGLLLAGLLLGLLRLQFRNLWPGIGFHGAWITLTLSFQELQMFTFDQHKMIWHGGFQPLDSWLGVMTLGLGASFYAAVIWSGLTLETASEA